MLTILSTWKYCLQTLFLLVIKMSCILQVHSTYLKPIFIRKCNVVQLLLFVLYTQMGKCCSMISSTFYLMNNSISYTTFIISCNNPFKKKMKENEFSNTSIHIIHWFFCAYFIIGVLCQTLLVLHHLRIWQYVLFS